MKATDQFKEVIQAHLEQRAAQDPLFAKTYAKENKNIDDCLTYILNEVQKSGCNGFADEEIFKMAVHFYDEDDIKPGKRPSATVVVNHAVELSEEEIAKAKQKALDEVVENEKKRLTTKKKATKTDEVVQASLF